MVYGLAQSIQIQNSTQLLPVGNAVYEVAILTARGICVKFIRTIKNKANFSNKFRFHENHE